MVRLMAAVVIIAGAAAVLGLAFVLFGPVIGPETGRGTAIVVYEDQEPQEESISVEMLPATGEVVVARGVWDGTPVIVMSAPRAYLEGVEAARGPDALLPAAIDHPEAADHVLFAYSAHSTHLGCTVVWQPTQPGGRPWSTPDLDGDGRGEGLLMDPCHQGRWDPFAGGVPVEGSWTAPTRLARLVIEVVEQDGEPYVFALGFDGPVGPTRN